MKRYILAAVAAPLFIALCTQAVVAEKFSFERWKTFTASGKSVKPAVMIEKLRNRGPQALEELLTVRERLSKRLSETDDESTREILTQELAELDQMIDAVGGQRYCSASKLFWYTDLERAREASRETQKPILSLRLLGNLTDELSCANSRFFRTTLYANTAISNYLRDNFVLHWESVRPAPVMTIDFGDGRRIIRTVTGNSVHYLLDAQGRPLDALPGLYGPQPFLEWLQRASALGTAIDRAASPDERSLILNDYHKQRLAAIQLQWQQDLNRLRLTTNTNPFGSNRNANDRPNAVAAEKAAAIALPKNAVEAKPIAMITMSKNDMAELTTDSVWRQIAKLHAQESELDAASKRLIYSEVPIGLQADLVAVTKSGVERSALERLLASLRSSTALDSVRNEYELHLQIHEWFLSGEAGDDVAALNGRVYAELFLTPETDPWLGLFDPTAYTALKDAGLVQGTE